MAKQEGKYAVVIGTFEQKRDNGFILPGRPDGLFSAQKRAQ